MTKRQTHKLEPYDFVVETGVELPPKRFCIYPFETMKVSDSFCMPSEYADRVRTAASIWGERNNARFTIRKMTGTLHRCWRTK